MKKSFHYQTRKVHRYLGLVLGIQFLLWTVGGLYFSWSDMDQVHGDYQKKAATHIPAYENLASPSAVFAAMRAQQLPFDSVTGIQLIEIGGQPVYQISYTDHRNHLKLYQLADAFTGRLRPALSEAEAIAEARSRYLGNANVRQVEYITQANTHHEYRENPLPAYAVTFDDPSHTTVYVATQPGTVQKFRNSEWRMFDFLWMLHTMDYRSRDNFGNLLLRTFSILGVITILSGFVLYIVSSPTLRRRKRKIAISR